MDSDGLEISLARCCSEQCQESAVALKVDVVVLETVLLEYGQLASSPRRLCLKLFGLLRLEGKSSLARGGAPVQVG